MKLRLISMLLVFSFIFVAPCAVAETEVHSAVVSTDGVERLVVDAKAGSLRIDGFPGIEEIRVKGVAGSTRSILLEEIRLESYVHGSNAFIIVHLPTTIFGAAYMDLTIEVPNRLNVNVKDSSGDLVIYSVSNLDIEDSSGSLKASYISGDLSIEDSSGWIEINRVIGNVRVRDGSGDLDIKNVSGDVYVLTDSSGDIGISDVLGSVTVQEDSSGDIRVSDVDGDFAVYQDGSGDITFWNIGGNVDIP